jgi:hypothetical protein
MDMPHLRIKTQPVTAESVRQLIALHKSMPDEVLTVLAKASERANAGGRAGELWMRVLTGCSCRVGPARCMRSMLAWLVNHFAACSNLAFAHRARLAGAPLAFSLLLLCSAPLLRRREKRMVLASITLAAACPALRPARTLLTV